LETAYLNYIKTNSYEKNSPFMCSVIAVTALTAAGIAGTGKNHQRNDPF
jgi:hypothetical protein